MSGVKRTLITSLRVDVSPVCNYNSTTGDEAQSSRWFEDEQDLMTHLEDDLRNNIMLDGDVFVVMQAVRERFRRNVGKMRSLHSLLPNDNQRIYLNIISEEYLWFASDLGNLIKDFQYDNRGFYPTIVGLMKLYRSKSTCIKSCYLSCPRAQEVYNAVFRIICREMEAIFGPIPTPDEYELSFEK